jgi:signal transduction histidine kinase
MKLERRWHYRIYSFVDEVRIRKNQSEYMSTINESATSLMQIVNDVLDFSKIESGKLELNIEGEFASINPTGY